jgi:RNA polymerase sigma factor (sigma-70 family)
MEPPPALPVTEANLEITATIRRETAKLAAFIRRRVLDVGEAEDILQDVFQEFVQACRLPEPIEQASSWLFRVARNRIIDFYRKAKSRPITERITTTNDDENAAQLDLALPAPDAGPEAAVARSLLLEALQKAVDELPVEQRDVFIAHEIEGLSFKEIANASGVAINTLLGRKRYAVLQLRRRLQPMFDEFDN